MLIDVVGTIKKGMFTKRDVINIKKDGINVKRGDVNNRIKKIGKRKEMVNSSKKQDPDQKSIKQPLATNES